MAIGQKNSPRYQGSNSRSSTTGLSYKAPSFVITEKDKKKLKLALNTDKPLLSYQFEGIRWLWELHNRCEGAGGILGDDMGVGKTYQIVIFIISLIQSKLIKKSLVVCPNTLMEQWSKEFLGSGLQTSIFYGSEKQSALESIEEGGVIITSYDTLSFNVQSLHSQRWDYLILDEGHLIKNSKTVRNNCLMDVNANHRVLLTGTMIQNSIDELWPLLNFCCPLEFDDLKHFRATYSKPIYDGTNENSTYEQEYGYLLRNAIKPYYIRRTKEEVLKLPKKHEVAVWLKLTSSQRFLYKTFLEDPDVLSAIHSEKAAFQVITLQKKLCDDPLLVNKGKGSGQISSKIASSILEEYLLNNGDAKSCKLLFLDILLADLCKNGHYVLIFSQIKDMLTKIQELLKARDFKSLRIDGECPLEDRYRKEFQSGAAQVLLLTTQVGGVGLTLTKADRVIIVDPSWNQSTDEQSVCRAYRLGQQNDVLVYRLLTCGTAEESIYKSQIYKQMLSKIVTEEKRPKAYFTEQERKDIFHINEEAFEKCLTQQKLDREHKCRCKMNRYLENHLSFLRKSNLVAGIGHHSHLFSEPALPSKEERRLPHAMTPKEFVSEKKVHKSSNRASVKKVAVKKVAESNSGLQAAERRPPHEKVQKPESKRGIQAAEAISQRSWFRPSSKELPATPKTLQEVKANIRPVSSSRLPVKVLCHKVPSEMVPFLKGKGGVSIQKLQADSRAHVQFCDGDQPNISVARITGSAEQVLTARSLINEQIKKANTVIFWTQDKAAHGFEDFDRENRKTSS
ncbi:SNF2-related protein [Artemisia annua]|uniref:SNF2-related protein n=1 Tax=Artemisia annua TaxID=35608 RepID=A0A2U1L3Q7_ARTAN|nr:SNF2-related protein [Artemisia annua]